MTRVILLFIVVSLISVAHCAVEIQSGEFINSTFTSPRYFTSFKDFGGFDPVTGYMTMYNASDVSGKIILSYSWLTGPTGFRELQDQGAIAIVSIDWRAVTGGSYCLFAASEEDVTIPIVQISYAKEANNENILKFIDSVVLGDEPLVTVSPDNNEWYATYTSIPFVILFRAVLGAIGVGLIVFAAVKMGFFLKIQGSQFNVPQVCLALEIIGNLIRVLYTVVDPFGCEITFGYAAGLVLQSLSIPFNLSTFMLITFYWYEAITDASIQIYAFLNKLKIVFFIVTIVIILVQIVLSILAVYESFNNIIPLAVIFIVISAGFLAFYVVTAIRISKRIKKALAMTAPDEDKMQNLKTVTDKMIFSGIARIIVIIVGVVYAGANRILEGTPVNRVTIWSMIYVALYLDIFARIYLFDTNRITSTKKSSGSASTNNSKTLSSKVSRTDLTSPEN